MFQLELVGYRLSGNTVSRSSKIIADVTVIILLMILIVITARSLCVHASTLIDYVMSTVVFYVKVAGIVLNTVAFAL